MFFENVFSIIKSGWLVVNPHPNRVGKIGDKKKKRNRNSELKESWVK